MGLTRLAIDRPLVVAMAIAALLLLGLQSLSRLPTELDPRVDIPVLTIAVLFPGASPAEIERQVARPIEDAVSTISQIRALASSSQESLCLVRISFELGADLDTALADVRARLDAARADLPPAASAPVTTKLDLSAQPVMVLGLTGSRSLVELRAFAEDQIKPVLSQVPGVASVQIVGGVVQEVQVAVDPSKLDANSLTLADVVSSLQAASLTAPAGSIETAGLEFSVRASGEFRNLQDIRQVPVGGTATDFRMPVGVAAPAERPTAPLLVQEIASVAMTPAEQETITRVNGRGSIGIVVTRSPDANTVAVAEGLRHGLETLQQRSSSPGQGEVPRRPHGSWLVGQGMEVTALRDQSTAVADALEDITVSLVLGALLAVAVVWLFLRNLRDTGIIALAIPCSLIPTFIVMYFGGFTLNQMTLLGLSLSIGILVDDSILVLDSIHRHRAMGKPPREAALDGRAEIGLADASNTFVDVIVFVPIAFMGGIVGQFFRHFGLTVATATLLSLYVSFTVAPMLAARAFRRRVLGAASDQGSAFGVQDPNPSHSAPYTPNPELPSTVFARGFERLEAGYRRALGWALRHRAAVVGIGYGSLLAALAAAVLVLGVDFVPPTDRGQVNVAVELPPGAALDATDRIVRRVDAAAAQIPEVRARLATIGEIPPGFGALPRRGSEVGQVSLTLHDRVGFLRSLLRPWDETGRRRSDEAIAAALRARLGVNPEARVTVSAVRGWSGSTAPLEVELRGDDLERLAAAARQVESELAKIPGVRHPDISLRSGRPEIRAEVDRGRAMLAGVTPAEVVTALRNAVQGNTDVHYRHGDQTHNVRVRMAGLQQAGPGALEGVAVAQRGGAPVTLGEVAALRREQGPTEIERKDRRRVVSVSAELAPGFALGNVQQTAARALERLPLSGVDLRWGGEVDEMASSARLLIGALLLAAALAYMLMAALFNSLIHPLTIMLSLPMALVGAIAALALAGETMNIVSMIGIIMLVGLVSKNAILLVDYTNTLRSRGLERDEAVRQAGPVRLRPIVMTTLSTVLAMLPIALRYGRAAEMRAPMAIAVIGGLVLSTLLTLLVIPVVYTLLDDAQQWLRTGRRKQELSDG